MLRDEIKPYVDVNGLVAPNLCDPNTRGSDNGPMFSSEYYIMLKKRGETIALDYVEYRKKIFNCMPVPGFLHRAPFYDAQEGPDDYYGVLAGSKAMETPQIAQMIIDYGWANRGVFNNKEPGKFSWDALLIRQPQLIAAAYAASGRSSVLLIPLYLYTALVILTSCMFTDKGNTDARRLPWLLIQTVKDASLMCELAAKVWYRRLYKDYGPDGMRAVARIYYQDGHPFQKYWVN